MESTRMRVVLYIAGILAASLGVTASPASAASCVLYASEASDSGRQLWLLDPTTADGAAVGDMGGEITGIAVHPATGILYGVTASIQLGPQNFDPGDLVIIDKATGAATLVGSLGLMNLSEEGPTLADIAFDPLTGILYGWRSKEGGDLYTVNLQTGTATLVGESGLTLSGGQGLTFGPQNNLYLAGEGTQGLLYTIDKTTGLPIGSVQLTDYADDSNIGALAFDGSRIFGITTDNPDLITINPVTGEITTIGETDSDALDGLAFDCRASAPAMSAVTLVCLGFGLLAIGLTRRFVFTHARAAARRAV